MLIAARNGFLAGKRILPPGARWVEYLESTGTQYIDTGIVSQQNLIYDINIKETTSNDQRTFFGFKEGTAWLGTGMNDMNWGSGFFYVDFASSNTNIKVPGYPNRNGLYHLDCTNGNASFALNGNQKWSSTRIGTYDGSRHVFLFAMDCAFNSYQGRFRYGIGQISKAIIYKNEVCLRDFRPIAIGNTGYMLDLVSGEYLQYGNAGTGSFVIGPDI